MSQIKDYRPRRWSDRLTGRKPENDGLTTTTLKRRLSGNFWGGYWGRASTDTNLKRAAVYKDKNGVRFSLSPINGEKYKYTRPAEESPNSKKKSSFAPKVSTPGKTPLYLESEFGAVAFYVEEKIQEPFKIHFPDNSEYSAAIYQEEILEKKEVNLHITLDTYNEVQKKIAKSKSRNQKKIMDNKSAKEVKSEDDSFNPNLKYEWLHLAAHHLCGPDGQKKWNLVAGTKHANTNMLLIVESHIVKLLEHGDVDLCVCAHVKKGTDIATKIDYKIIHNDQEINFHFDADIEKQPHVINAKYGEKILQKRLSFSSSETQCLEEKNTSSLAVRLT